MTASAPADPPAPDRGDNSRPVRTGGTARSGTLQRLKLPALVYLVCALVYVGLLGDRMLTPSPDNHYIHLAEGWLEGRLDLGGDPPGTNDWACVDTETWEMCPNGRFRFGEQERYRWYVSFPPFPAVVALPAAAIWGTALPDRLFWALIAAFGPALLYSFLRRLREEGISERSHADDLLLTALFAFGTVFFFVAVQGTVWFAAHAVAVPLLVLYLDFGMNARRPVLAGLALGLAFLTRPTTAMLAIYFGIEAIRRHQKASDSTLAPDAHPLRHALAFVLRADWLPVFHRVALFSAPILVVGAVAMWHNHVRFGDPFEWGHSYLQIRWRPRIETWGLFNYHFVGRNLGIFSASLPWLSAEAPHVTISRHGLALWFTTPGLLYALWPKRIDARWVAIAVAVVPVMLLNLAYQNSGWVQFGYRFALDYLAFVFALLALSGRRFGPIFKVLFVWALVVNLFGAITFDRMWQFYDHDPTQNVFFQPD